MNLLQQTIRPFNNNLIGAIMQTETTNFLDELLAEVEAKEQQQSEAFLI
jgi:hypothetical protein